MKVPCRKSYRMSDRLSYYEMYTDEFKYANELTTSIEIKEYIWALVDKIKDMVNNYDEYKLKNVELQQPT